METGCKVLGGVAYKNVVASFEMLKNYLDWIGQIAGSNESSFIGAMNSCWLWVWVVVAVQQGKKREKGKKGERGKEEGKILLMQHIICPFLQ